MGKTNEEPRKHRLEYDLYLQPLNGSPINNVRKERLTFLKPGDDFRRKLLAGGGELQCSGKDDSSAGNDRSGGARHSSGAKIKPHGAQVPSNSQQDAKKYKTDLKKDGKPKQKPESDAFSALFGEPIKKGQELKKIGKEKPPKEKDKEKDKIRDKDKEKLSSSMSSSCGGDEKKKSKDKHKSEKQSSNTTNSITSHVPSSQHLSSTHQVEDKKK